MHRWALHITVQEETRHKRTWLIDKPFEKYEHASVNELNYFSPVTQLPLTASEIEEESNKQIIILKAIDFILKGWPVVIKYE